MQSTSARSWEWTLFDWSRWFDIHTVGPQSYYPGIRLQRPDVLAWYMKQGRERPIYMCQVEPEIMGSVAYPKAAMEAEFGVGRFGCQLDYMAALALHEGFDTFVLYGIGAPYINDPFSESATKWFHFHRTFLWWLRLARERGVDIVFDGPNMFRPEIRGDDPPPEAPMAGSYGFDMGVSLNQFNFVASEGHPFHRD